MNFFDIDKTQVAYLTQLGEATTLVGPALVIQTGSITQHA